MASYQDLKVWQLGIELALSVYKLSSEFQKSEQYGLTSQLRRAAVSIPSNIAEGHARKTQPELQRYLSIAQGSLAELETQLIIARELGFAERSEIEAVLMIAENESRMLSGLMRSVRNSQ